MKLTRFIFIFLLTGIVLFLITLDIPGNSQSRPTAAIVEALSGRIRAIACAGCSSSEIRSGARLEANTSTLIIPPTVSGGTEYWAHLRLTSPTSRNIALVQAGTDRTESRYTFPCNLSQGTGVWGLRTGSSTACSRITVNSPQWQSRLNAPSIAQKSALSTESSLTAQQDSELLTITVANRLTVVYIYQTPDSTIVNVLAGSARIRAASGSLILNAGTRYIDYGGDDDGDTGPIPEDVYTARPVQIFLDPNNWSQDLRVQIGEFQRVVDQTRATAPLAPPDPEPIYEPEPLDWDTDLSPDGSDDSNNEDSSGDDPYDPQLDPPDSTAPPVSDDSLDNAPIDDPTIDYGGSAQPAPSDSGPIVR